ncbi:transmembrane protein 26-like [Asterias rubens]|uniref:transmembrane protein 26-like n=1 Tax=Asterias rubens TaxID=7604 RepID=UPI00145565CC|nr:transmembrane protein 26-like [Asterias rubens]
MLFKKALKASIVRFCYLAHGTIGVFMTVYLTGNNYFWFVSVTVLVYMMEMILTFGYNEDGEWRWFFPLVLIYLCNILPVVWVLEVSLLESRIDFQKRLNYPGCIVRLGDCERNHTVIFSQLDNDNYELKLSVSAVYQQTLMLVLIVGRWVLPKGAITRNELSQLLLVYIGMAADMLEFSSETLKLQKIACNKTIYLAILIVWSWSLLQFTLGLTSTKKRRRAIDTTVDEETGRWAKSVHQLYGVFCGTALWALMTDVILQDGPYLIMRIYLIFGLDVYDQSLIFFTCKNALLLVLQLYRLNVVLTENNNHSARGSTLELRETSRHRGANGNMRDIARSNGTRRNGVIASISQGQEITVV